MSCLCLNNVAWATVKRGMHMTIPHAPLRAGKTEAKGVASKSFFGQNRTNNSAVNSLTLHIFMSNCYSVNLHGTKCWITMPQRVISSDTKNGGFGCTPAWFDQKFGPCSLPSASIPSTRCRSPRVSYASPLSQS